MWVHEPRIRKTMGAIIREQSSAYPSENFTGYDCSLYTFASRLPGMDAYMETMPFCDRLQGQPLVKRVARRSVEWAWKPKYASRDRGGSDQCSRYEMFNGKRLAESLAVSSKFPHGRWLYIIGDSTTEHMWASLVCLVGSKNVDRIESEYAREEQDAIFHDLQPHDMMKKVGVLVLNGGGRILWMRSNHMVSEKTGHVEARVMRIPRVWKQEQPDGSISKFYYTEHEIPWPRQIRRGAEGSGDIVVFNTGAHGEVTL